MGRLGFVFRRIWRELYVLKAGFHLIIRIGPARPNRFKLGPSDCDGDDHMETQRIRSRSLGSLQVLSGSDDRGDREHLQAIN